jgi:Variant UBP zinc finger
VDIHGSALYWPWASRANGKLAINALVPVDTGFSFILSCKEASAASRPRIGLSPEAFWPSSCLLFVWQPRIADCGCWECVLRCTACTMAEAVLDRVRSALGDVKIPGTYDKVYKDECVYSFCSPESPDGLFVCLKTWHGVGSRFLEMHHQRTGSSLYYHELHVRVPLSEESHAPKDVAPTKLAIGGPDGFQVDQRNYSIEKKSALMIMPEKNIILLPNTELPEKILQAIASIQVSSADYCCPHTNVTVKAQDSGAPRLCVVVTTHAGLHFQSCCAAQPARGTEPISPVPMWRCRWNTYCSSCSRALSVPHSSTFAAEPRRRD